MNELRIKLENLVKELRGAYYPNPCFSDFDEGKRVSADKLEKILKEFDMSLRFEPATGG